MTRSAALIVALWLLGKEMAKHERSLATADQAPEQAR